MGMNVDMNGSGCRCENDCAIVRVVGDCSGRSGCGVKKISTLQTHGDEN